MWNKTNKYDQDIPPTKHVRVEKTIKIISLSCTCYKSLVSSAQKTRKKGKKVVKTNNGGNLCSLFPLIQIKKANNFLPMHDCCTINNFRIWWFSVCIMYHVQGISGQSVKSNSALVRIQIWIFANIRGPMCYWETPFFAYLTSFYWINVARHLLSN